jgi:hypothetical protein
MNSGESQYDICISCTVLHVMLRCRDYVYPAVVWWALAGRDSEQLSPLACQVAAQLRVSRH